MQHHFLWKKERRINHTYWLDGVCHQQNCKLIITVTQVCAISVEWFKDLWLSLIISELYQLACITSERYCWSFFLFSFCPHRSLPRRGHWQLTSHLTQFLAILIPPTFQILTKLHQRHMQRLGWDLCLKFLLTSAQNLSLFQSKWTFWTTHFLVY